VNEELDYHVGHTAWLLACDHPLNVARGHQELTKLRPDERQRARARADELRALRAASSGERREKTP
jgi:hypothetical protein